MARKRPSFTNAQNATLLALVRDIASTGTYKSDYIIKEAFNANMAISKNRCRGRE